MTQNLYRVFFRVGGDSSLHEVLVFACSVVDAESRFMCGLSRQYHVRVIRVIPEVT